MNYNLSKRAKIIILINVILAILMLSYHIYNIYRMNVSNGIINDLMVEKGIIRDTAIRELERNGVELFIDKEFTTYMGIFTSTLTLFLVFKYYTEMTFFFGFLASFASIFSTFIGGFLLFYILLSGKSETRKETNREFFKTDFEEYIHKRVDAKC